MPIPTSSRTGQQRNRVRSQQDWRRRLKYYYWRLLRLQGNPQEMARGLASGVFAGCFPLFGLQTIIGIAIATVLRGNRILAAAGTWISNPLTYVPLFAFNYQVGHRALGGGPGVAFTDLGTLRAWMEMGTEVTSRLMLGSTIVGLLTSLFSYYLGSVLLRRLHERRKRARLRQR
ncbi:DUF2062 domain-containing protein [Pseudanabaena sp. FACHB-2040]|uniref:DUF2062 domain-containing protein n=1 Tax=Pseudanabaena sp. FACHB-2040 TaxID=2692859 RepID=UPI001683F787|nr:DUF2062 domain-containing protein [Pseudanabaena sp. FACHB-2040]MBD2260460.1 DUF2062 domain-containing protein [Pseudanabaena sp. FACHB-2040]